MPEGGGNVLLQSRVKLERRARLGEGGMEGALRGYWPVFRVSTPATWGKVAMPHTHQTQDGPWGDLAYLLHEPREACNQQQRNGGPDPAGCLSNTESIWALTPEQFLSLDPANLMPLH